MNKREKEISLSFFYLREEKEGRIKFKRQEISDWAKKYNI